MCLRVWLQFYPQEIPDFGYPIRHYLNLDYFQNFSYFDHRKMSILLPRLTNFTWVGPWWLWWWSEEVMEVNAEAGWLLRLKLKLTLPAPKLASNSVAILTCGGFPVAFCTTRNNLVTISMTWPVWKTKSPLRLMPSEDKHPGTTLGWLRNSLVGLVCKSF